MNGGSLFSGCGGLDLGLERAGVKMVWACDTDPPSRRTLRRNRPRLDVVDDVRLIDESAPRVDLLAGGFPCQPVSVAGRRAGQADERWLWPEMARCVRVLGPRVVVVENVPGLALRGLGDVLGDLAALGYLGFWFRLRAADVGAPHRRERIFIVAIADPGRAGTGRDGRAASGGQEPARRIEPDQADIPLDRAQGASGSATDAGLERRAALDPGSRRRETRTGADGHTPPDAVGVARTPTQERDSRPDTGRLEAGHARGEEEHRATRGAGAPADWGAYAPAIERWERLLGRPAPVPVNARGRLEPAFVEWMMGFPDGWTDGETRTARLRMLGNAVHVQVAEVVGRVAVDLAA